MTLPKAEDILNRDYISTKENAIKAMKEYARQVLDYAAEKLIQDDQKKGILIIGEAQQSILKIKNEL